MPVTVQSARKRQEQSAAELLAKLEKQGLVSREPSAEDKRKLMVSITEAGLAEAEQMETDGPALPFFDCLTDQEKANLEDYLVRISAALEDELRA